MTDYVKLVKVRGSEAGKTTEVTRFAYDKNKTGVFKDWQIKEADTKTAPTQQPTTPPKQEPASAGAAGGEANNTNTAEDELDGYTVKQLKAYAEQEGIEYADPIKKAELIDLIKSHTRKK